MRNFPRTTGLVLSALFIALFAFGANASAQTVPTPSTVPTASPTPVTVGLQNKATQPVTLQITSSRVVFDTTLQTGEFTVGIASLGNSSLITATLTTAKGVLLIRDGTGYKALDEGKSSTFEWNSSNSNSTTLTVLQLRSNGASFSITFDAVNKPGQSDVNYTLVYTDLTPAASANQPAQPAPTAVQGSNPGAADVVGYGLEIAPTTVVKKDDTNPPGLNSYWPIGMLAVLIVAAGAMLLLGYQRRTPID